MPLRFQEFEAHMIYRQSNVGVEVVSPTHRPRLLPQEISLVRRPQGHSAAGWIKSIINPNDRIGNRTRDITACNAVAQPPVSPRAAEHLY
jgi:uncharacterized protein (DUF2235 family)